MGGVFEALLRVFLVCVVTCCNAVFVLQGSPGLPSLAALHSNQILTVKVCLVEMDAAAAAATAAQSRPLPSQIENCAQTPELCWWL